MSLATQDSAKKSSRISVRDDFSLSKNFKLGFIGVEVSWRERRQGSALHPPKDPFLKGPLDSPKIFMAGV